MTTTTTLSVYDKVCRLLAFATGEEYGDGYVVTDVMHGYAEPGYPSDAVVVLGDWNPRHKTGEDRWKSEDPYVTMPPRLARSLERVGAEIEWLDEWTSCHECLRAVRTEGNSYHWKPSYAFTGDGFFCAECLHGWGDEALTDYVNDSQKCVTWCEPSHVESLGYVKWEPGNEHTYASGWYPGQTDDPGKILASILERHPDAEVVFFLDSTGQFDIHFSAYVRGLLDDDDAGLDDEDEDD